jgi:hypothetical protein
MSKTVKFPHREIIILGETSKEIHLMEDGRLMSGVN